MPLFSGNKSITLERRDTDGMDRRKNTLSLGKSENERYIRYHDEEWGAPVHDDRKLFEMLILECFQAGLSWECVLNKRDAFREASVTNARVFREIQKECNSFSEYLWHWTDGKVVFENGRTSSELSDSISKDLKKRGMKFVGTTVIYAYLQAIGVIYSHKPGCFLSHVESKT